MLGPELQWSEMNRCALGLELSLHLPKGFVPGGKDYFRLSGLLNKFRFVSFVSFVS